jgi:CRISPR-associated protein Csd1
VVRDWTEGRFDELLNNSLAWFADLAIVSPDGESIAPPPKLGAILAALARSPREVPAPLAAALWRAATRRQPIPREALARAVERFRAEVVAEKRPNRARAGLMKAALLRNRIAVGEYLNEYHASAAYHCGRLVAVAAEAHAASLGPSFGPRAARAYYLIAHVDPGRALPMLLADLGFHRDRLFGTPSGALLSAETRAILDEIRGRGGAPEFLLLEDRCLFSLGFYQQRASLIRRASDSPAEPDPEKRPQPYTKTEPDSEPAADTSPSA